MNQFSLPGKKCQLINLTFASRTKTDGVQTLLYLDETSVRYKDYKEDERTQNLLAPDNNIDILKHFMNIFLKNQSTELYYASF